ncbi:esterase EstD [Thermotoga profunda]|uniref:esterase EstD n=1 Tax=Thermotoga profunda TaxID=1508420 RepID=UPI000693BB48|nr:esterase EstD [Thermotoga profunda]
MKKSFVILMMVSSTLLFASNYEQTAVAFIQYLSTGEFDKAQQMVSQVMLDALKQSKLTLESFWKTLNSQVGNFKQILRVKSTTEQGYNVVFVGCDFEKMKLDAKIVFDQQEKIAGLQFLPYIEERTYTIPNYVKAEKFKEIDCVIKNKQWELPAVLTLPEGNGPFAAVILVHGSGPNDKDETIGPNKPFKDIAWGLASNGIAVLRYDKRTKVYPEECVKMIDTFTVNDETVDDALAAIDLLKNFEKIDKDKIFILGHSLGATMAPRIAARSEKLAGIILLAPTARGLYILNALDQLEYIFSLDGKIDESESKQLLDMREQLERIQKRQLKDNEVVLGSSKAYWYDLLDYNPVELAKSLTVPILIMQGARDYQVTMKDFGIWHEVLKGKRNVAFKVYEDLNHLFIPGKGPSTPAEYQQPGNVDSKIIEDIVQWIKSLLSN